ncbi:hypothetical protein [Caballeronia sp. S22]|uniref:hypothetical protein n=1 Tax=Caballeronia sp. S22 TaxID=3137182 RepID=UPI003530FAE4
MEQILEIVLRNPPILYVPALGVVLALMVLRIQKRYVNQGYIFRRSTTSSSEHHPSLTAEDNMSTENELDLEIALRKIHELALADGDLGHEYWRQVGQLLRRAADMQSQIDALNKELELCHAKQRKRH